MRPDRAIAHAVQGQAAAQVPAVRAGLLAAPRVSQLGLHRFKKPFLDYRRPRAHLAVDLTQVLTPVHDAARVPGLVRMVRTLDGFHRRPDLVGAPCAISQVTMPRSESPAWNRLNICRTAAASSWTSSPAAVYPVSRTPAGGWPFSARWNAASGCRSAFGSLSRVSNSPSRPAMPRP